MAKFDLERARAGDQVQANTYEPNWFDVHFVGMSITGLPVVQQNGHPPFSATFDRVRMAPKVKTMWVQAYKAGESICCTHPCDSAEFARDAVDRLAPEYRARPIGEPQPITITEE